MKKEETLSYIKIMLKDANGCDHLCEDDESCKCAKLAEVFCDSVEAIVNLGPVNNERDGTMTEYYVVSRKIGGEQIAVFPTAAKAIMAGRKEKEKNAPVVTVYNKNKTITMLSNDTFCLPAGKYCSDVEAIVYLEGGDEE